MAGRAGRFQSVMEDMGEVTCMNGDDLSYMQKCLREPDEPITKAGT